MGFVFVFVFVFAATTYKHRARFIFKNFLFFFFFFKKFIYFLIEGYLLYSILLFSVKYQPESAIGVPYVPSLLNLPPISLPIPPF